MKKKKRKLKKRNCFLLLIIVLLFCCVLVEMSYTYWIFNDYHVDFLSDASSDMHKCLEGHHILLSDCLISLSENNEELTFTNDKENLRYVGSNPNNYLSLGDTYDTEIYRGISKNNELDVKYFVTISDCIKEDRKCSIYHHIGDPVLWRIVGIFTMNGKKYPKLVRDENIGSYSWDSSLSDVNDGYGINEWSSSSLNALLNNEYYESSSGKCQIKKNEESIDCSFNEFGIKNGKDYIAEVNWNLGTMDESSYLDSLVNTWYEKERASALKFCSSGTYCNDVVERTSNSLGKIGLLYPSDIAYATKDEACMDIPISKWNNKDLSSCINNNWLFQNKDNTWLITPLGFSNSNAYATSYSSLGIKEAFVSTRMDIFPSLYLKDSVKIAGGYGTKEKPYLIQ